MVNSEDWAGEAISIIDIMLALALNSMYVEFLKEGFLN